MTSEATWNALAASLPRLAAPLGPVVVAAPHPDDETLAVGGLLAHLARWGQRVDVVAVTDGEASHPEVDGLAGERAAEQDGALAALGVGSPVRRLHLPDGAVADHEDEIADVLAAACAPGTTLLAPWIGDGHCDHDAVGRAATVAAARAGVPLLGYLVWAWQWARPDDLSALPLRRFDVPASLRSVKADAVARFTSQTGRYDPPILPPAVLARFARPHEVLVDAGA